MRDPFKPHGEKIYRGITGGLLDKMSAGHNAALLGHTNSRNTVHYSGIVHQTTPPPSLIQGIAVIVDASDGCLATTDSPVETGAPCSSSHKYVCRFRHYDSDIGAWVEYDENIWLDASGYWEGRSQSVGDIAVGDQASTEASQSPTSGIGFGAVPTFRVGDMVTAYYDISRGWAIPIYTPPADVPRLYVVSDTCESVFDKEGGEAQENTATVYLEKREAGKTEWNAVGEAHFKIPVDDDDNYYDTRFGDAFFTAPAAPQDQPSAGISEWTTVRMRVIAPLSDYSVAIRRSTIELFGAGRRSADSEDGHPRLIPAASSLDGMVRTGWETVAQIPGRYYDAPEFVPNADGTINVQYNDPIDNWIIGARFSARVSAVYGDEDECESTSSLSTSSKSGEDFSSSVSSQSNPLFDWSSESSSSSAQSQSVSSISSVSSVSSTSTESDSMGAQEPYCLCRVVTDVLCDGSGAVLEVCYSWIAFPKIRGVDCGVGLHAACGLEQCEPCSNLLLMSSESSISTSTSSTSSTSEGISSSSSLPDFDCIEFDILEAIEASAPDATSKVTANIIQPVDSIAQEHWDNAWVDNTVYMDLLNKHGAKGTVTYNEDTGEVTYTPPADGSEADQTITLDWLVCDKEDLGPSSASSPSSSSISSSVSSLSSISSSSESSSASSISSSESSISSNSSSTASSSPSSQSSQSSWSTGSSASLNCEELYLKPVQEGYTAGPPPTPIDFYIAGDAGQDWPGAIVNGDVVLTLISNSGAGTLEILTRPSDGADNGYIRYTPTTVPDETGATIVIVMQACDLATGCCDTTQININVFDPENPF